MQSVPPVGCQLSTHFRLFRGNGRLRVLRAGRPLIGDRSPIWYWPAGGISALIHSEFGRLPVPAPTVSRKFRGDSVRQIEMLKKNNPANFQKASGRGGHSHPINCRAPSRACGISILGKGGCLTSSARSADVALSVVRSAQFRQFGGFRPSTRRG